MDAYTVGYKRPPLETRFSKGESGNPLGRPRKLPETERNLLEISMDKLIQIRDGDVVRTITRRRAMVEGYARAAANGDLEAIKALIILRRYAMGGFKGRRTITQFLDKDGKIKK
jgi:hypothetical protein